MSTYLTARKLYCGKRFINFCSTSRLSSKGLDKRLPLQDFLRIKTRTTHNDRDYNEKSSILFVTISYGPRISFVTIGVVLKVENAPEKAANTKTIFITVRPRHLDGLAHSPVGPTITSTRQEKKKKRSLT